MYPIPKVHWNHEFLTYIIIIKGCYWKIKSVNKDLPLISNRIQSMHEIIIVFQKRNNDQIWKPVQCCSKSCIFVCLNVIPGGRGMGGLQYNNGWICLDLFLNMFKFKRGGGCNFTLNILKIKLQDKIIRSISKYMY